MAKAQVAARLIMTEVAPPPVVSVVRGRKVPCCLDTIAEDTIAEQLVACGSPSDLGFAAAWSLPQPRERAGGFMARDPGNYFSDATHSCQCQATGWEGGHIVGLRGAVPAQELHTVGA